MEISERFEITYTSQYIPQTFATSNDRVTRVAACYNHPLSNSGRKWSTWKALWHLVSFVFSSNRDCGFQVPLWFKERHALMAFNFLIFFDHDYFSHFFFSLTLASFSLFSRLMSSPCLLVESHPVAICRGFLFKSHCPCLTTCLLSFMYH